MIDSALGCCYTRTSVRIRPARKKHNDWLSDKTFREANTRNSKTYRSTSKRRARKPQAQAHSDDLLPGVVVRARGHHYDVQIEGTENGRHGASGDVRVCEVRGRLLQERGRDTLVAVGDRVWVKPDGARRGLIERVDERHSVLSRQHPGVSVPAEDVILANPDQALLVFSVTQPEPHLRMLDRFLVIAEANELPAIICANKIDLTGEDHAAPISGRLCGSAIG